MTRDAAKIFLLLLNLSFISSSCGDSSRSNDTLLAQSGDAYLYANDIKGLVAPGTSKTDSITIVKNYTREWINRQLLLQYANANGKSDPELDKTVENFKNDLIIARFEEDYLSKNLDTAVTEKQINDYYQQNQSAFELGDYALRACYFKFDASEPGIDKMEKELKVCENPQQIKAFDEKYNSVAINSMADTETWIYFHDLQKEIPLQVEDKTRFLEQNIFMRTDDDEFVYLLRILDYKLKNESSPLSLVTPTIKSLILRKRSSDLLNTMRNDIIKKQSSITTSENYVK